MASVKIYTTPYCPYCMRAKSLLKRKGVEFQDIDVSHFDVRAEMMQLSGGRQTVPQIFINGHHVGGSDELHALDAKGELDPLLEAAHN